MGSLDRILCTSNLLNPPESKERKSCSRERDLIGKMRERDSNTRVQHKTVDPNRILRDYLLYHLGYQLRSDLQITDKI